MNEAYLRKMADLENKHNKNKIMPTNWRNQIEEILTNDDSSIELYDLSHKMANRIEQLEQRDSLLQCLENAGVDNWEGYDKAIKELFYHS